jgi:hypothetical protein
MAKQSGKRDTRTTDMNDLRQSVMVDEFETDFNVREVRRDEVEARIFGLTAGERMILSIILFLAVSVLSMAILFATNTIMIGG